MARRWQSFAQARSGWRRVGAVLAGVLLLLGLLGVALAAMAQTDGATLARFRWGQGVPAFSYPFSRVPLVSYPGSTTKQVGTYSFPVSEGMAGVYMTLEPGAMREPHWHALAAEWGYVIEGRTRITLTSPQGQVQIADVDAGNLWYFPKGWGHSIEGLGPGTARFLLVFNNGSFKEGSTFSISDWIAHTPIAWVAQGLGISPAQVQQLPDRQVYISQRPPAPGPLAQARPRNPQLPPLPLSHVFNLAGQPASAAQAGSSIRLASVKEFPASLNMAGAILHLEPGALRAPHWHPNANEWQYVLQGSLELSVFASEGKAALSSLAQGDVGYVPMGYGHALRNSAKGPTDVLIVFDQGEYQSIDLSGWIASTPAAVLANTLGVSAQLVDQLPRRDAELVR